MSGCPDFWRRVLGPVRVSRLGIGPGLRLGIGLATGLGIALAVELSTGQRAIAAAVAPSAAPDGLCPAELPAAIDAIADRPPWQRSRWGILVQTLDGDQTLYARDAQHYFIPASNGKLLTTAAALTRLGGDFRIRTVVYASDRSGDSATQASTGTTLTVVGRGDPSLSDDSLRQLAQQVRDRGITQVDRLIADDRYIPDSLIHPNWEWEDIQAGYGAPVTSLMVNENAIALNLFPQAIGQPLRAVWVDAQEGRRWRLDNQTQTVAADQPGYVWVERDLGQAVLHLHGQLPVGSAPVQEAIAVPDPTEHFLRHFRQALMAAGVSVRQTQVVPSGAIAGDPTNPTEIAAIASPPLSTLLITANQDSNNLYAEALLRILGIAFAAPDLPESSLESGITAVEAILTPLGVDPEGYALADGSGLSRHNLASPVALVQTLQAMADAPTASAFRQSLAVAGVSGTLRRRFVDTAIAGRLWGKSGAMGGVASLSGYLEPPHYPPLAFSIVVNQFEQPVRQVRPVIDEIVLLLGRLRPC